MYLFSNEIVFRGHPDKVCDQISDALLDAYMTADPYSRCGIEVMGGKGNIFVTGEVTSKTRVDEDYVINKVLESVGYDPFAYKKIINLGKQSPDIALGTNNEVNGAGDNGMMFGYACDDTEECLPTAMVILQKLSIWYDGLRQKDHRFLPDGKAQITGNYFSDGKLESIKTFTVCYQNTEEERLETDAIIINKINELCDQYSVPVEKVLINPTGMFQIGGFEGDAGLTGRKIVVDSYQGFAPVGGGAFSGKDPTKVDRTAAYKARQLAKRILQHDGSVHSVLIQLSYAIGLTNPLAIGLTINGTRMELVSDELYEECSVRRMIDDLGLRHKKFEPLARFGHFTD